LYLTSGKDWAKDLLYKQEGEDDPVQIEDASSEPGKEADGDSDSSSSSDSSDEVAEVVPEATAEPALDETPVEEAVAEVPAEAPPTQVEQAAQVETTPAASQPAEESLQSETVGVPEPRQEQERKMVEKTETTQNKKSKKTKKENADESDDSSDSSEDEDELNQPPADDHKTKMCHAFLNGRCHKGRTCTQAHSATELKDRGEALAEFKKRLRQKHQQMPSKTSRSAPKAPKGRVPPRWPPHDVLTMGMAPMMGIPAMPHMMDPMMMGVPAAMMHIPMMGHMPPEMMPGYPAHMHPHMAVMMDPSAMASGEKRRKHDKSRKAEKEQDRDRQKSKKGKKEKEDVVVVVSEKQKSKKDKKEKASGKDRRKEPEVAEDRGKAKNQKASKRKEHVREVPIEKAGKKERKVDDEDL